MLFVGHLLPTRHFILAGSHMSPRKSHDLHFTEEKMKPAEMKQLQKMTVSQWSGLRI